MSEYSDSEILHLLPQAATEAEVIPPPCSVGKYYPDILLRNDGFNARAAYTFDDFYATFANILGNMERMQVDGAVLQVSEDPHSKRLIDIMLLYDARRLLTAGFTLDAGEMRFFQQPGTTPGILHHQPEAWNYEGQVTEEVGIKFRPVYDIPLNYTLYAKRTPGAEKRNLDAPSMIIAYGKRAVSEYALRHHQNPPLNQSQNPLSNDVIVDSLMLAAREVSSKISILKGLK